MNCLKYSKQKLKPGKDVTQWQQLPPQPRRGNTHPSPLHQLSMLCWRQRDRELRVPFVSRATNQYTVLLSQTLVKEKTYSRKKGVASSVLSAPTLQRTVIPNVAAQIVLSDIIQVCVWLMKIQHQATP